MSTSVLTVSALNFYVKSLLDGDAHLRTVFLSGEISNLTDHYRSGHIYLSLKDEKSAIKAVMFAAQAQRLKFRPQDGMKVIVRGRVSLYEATGQYQFYIDDMQPNGIGALNLAFEQLKAKLSKEGLFDESLKKPLPTYPSRIAVITSPTGAAVQDICKIIKRRYPIAEIIMCPVLVQGENAPPQLIAALDKVNALQCADVIIIGRGGGSIEDLWAFNDEQVVQAVARSVIPVISAVGHETDFTLCDFAADVRASTPSAAAELATPLISEMQSNIKDLQQRLYTAITSHLSNEHQRLDLLTVKTPQIKIENEKEHLKNLTYRLNTEYQNQISSQKQTLLPIISRLETLSPLKLLSCGYAVAEKSETVIKSVETVSVGDEVSVRLSDGRLLCRVIEKEKRIL